jgi:hypothetical protein
MVSYFNVKPVLPPGRIYYDLYLITWLQFQCYIDKAHGKFFLQTTLFR